MKRRFQLVATAVALGLAVHGHVQAAEQDDCPEGFAPTSYKGLNFQKFSFMMAYADGADQDHDRIHTACTLGEAYGQMVGCFNVLTMCERMETIGVTSPWSDGGAAHVDIPCSTMINLACVPRDGTNGAETACCQEIADQESAVEQADQSLASSGEPVNEARQAGVFSVLLCGLAFSAATSYGCYRSFHDALGSVSCGTVASGAGAFACFALAPLPF